MHKIFFITSLLNASTCFEHCYVHHQEVKIVLYSLWYHHTCRWPSGAQVERRLFSQPVYETATYRCDDTRCCIYNFDLLMMSTYNSKHVNLLQNKIFGSSWLITRIQIPRLQFCKDSSYFPCESYMPLPSHPSWFEHCNIYIYIYIYFDRIINFAPVLLLPLCQVQVFASEIYS